MAASRLTSWTSGPGSRKTGRADAVPGPARAREHRHTTQPVSRTAALASFTEIYSPRIVARVNDYDVRIAHVKGEHVWHVHDDTDESFLVLDGKFTVWPRDVAGAGRVVELGKGDVYVVARGTGHKPSSAGGSILLSEPTGTPATGDRHEGEIPGHADSTAGRPLGAR